MRVAIDTNGLFTGQAGGARYIRGLLSGMRSLQPPDLEFFPFAWEVENLGYSQPARGLRTVYRELIWGKTLAPRLLLKRQASLYHATGSYFVSVPESVRCVVTLYDLAMLRHPERFRAWQRWSETRRLRTLSAVDRILCISRFTANEAMALLGLPARQLEVIYCGTDLASHPPVSPEQPLDFPVPAEFFLFVGSLEPGKNLALLKEACRLASEQGRPLPPLLIVGARWAGVGTEGQPPNGWQYLGQQPDAVLAQLYRRALALVFPSKYEGFGLPLVESMSLGCPVICSPVASLPEVGGKAALWTELAPNAYLQAMREIASNAALRSDLIRAGLDQAAQFTWEQCARETAAVYRSVISNQ